MIIKTLENTNLKNLLNVFNGAFENYFIPLKLTSEQFNHKIKADNIMLNLSVGMFVENKIVGFILHGIDYFDKDKYVYNAGTGVIKDYRGKSITKQLYKYIIPILKVENVKFLIHEVVKQNEIAKSIYEDVGFSVIRTLDCMKTYKKNVLLSNYSIIQLSGNKITPEINSNEMVPTWQNSTNSIERQKNNITQLLIKDNNIVLGNLIMNPLTGRILRLNVKPNHRRQGIGSALINESAKLNSNLSVINLDISNIEIISFFKSQGFKSFLGQYEMSLRLT